MKRIYKIMFGVSLAMVAVSVIALGVWGLRLGVDFKGGTVWELEFAKGRPEATELQALLTTNEVFKDALVSTAGESGLVVRMATIAESDHQWALQAIQNRWKANEPREVQFDSIGPAVGTELKTKSLHAVVLVLLAITCYIALVFRSMRRVLSPWAMSFAAVIALLHDVIIPVGVFAWLGHAYGVEISAVFVAAILTILGFSVSDTVVIFDRVRENILRGMKGSFAEIVHASVMQTLVRSINTTMTTLISLVAIGLFGGQSIRLFALALILGFTLGAYSSVFVASPLLVWLGKRGREGR